MLLRYLLYAFLFYFLYRLIFHFIIPVFLATRKMRKQFRQARETMEQQQAGFRQQEPAPSHSGKKSDGMGEYIDFEEVK